VQPVDAASFAIMKRARIQLAYAFDHHFAIVGFRLVAARKSCNRLGQPGCGLKNPLQKIRGWLDAH
jgi:hypothetical protein